MMVLCAKIERLNLYFKAKLGFLTLAISLASGIGLRVMDAPKLPEA